MECSVINCKNVEIGSPYVILYRIPSILKQTQELSEITTRRQNAWLAAIQNIDLQTTPLENIRVCSEHFRKGRPAYLGDHLNPDWVPSLKMGHENTTSRTQHYSINEQNQFESAAIVIEDEDDKDIEENENDGDDNDEESISNEDPFDMSENEIALEDNDENDEAGQNMNINPLAINENEDMLPESEFISLENKRGGYSNTSSQKLKSTRDLDGIQTLLESMKAQLRASKEVIKTYKKEKEMAEEKVKTFKQLVVSCEQKIKNQDALIQDLQTKGRCQDTGIEALRYDTEKVGFFTGLPNFEVLNKLYQLVENDINKTLVENISAFDSFILTLMKFRFDQSMLYLKFKYRISEEEVSTVYQRNILYFYNKIGALVKWPSKEIWLSKTPGCFKRSMENKCVVIIHFLETEAETTSERRRRETFPLETNHITIKYLIAFSPYGAIVYVSRGFREDNSDENIIAQSGFLRFIEKDNVVLSVRKILKNNYKKGNVDSNTFDDVEQVKKVSSTIATKIIDLLRERYKIISNRQTFSCKGLNIKHLEYDRIVKCCCALINLNPPEFNFEQPKQDVPEMTCTNTNKKMKLC